MIFTKRKTMSLHGNLKKNLVEIRKINSSYKIYWDFSKFNRLLKNFASFSKGSTIIDISNRYTIWNNTDID